MKSGGGRGRTWHQRYLGTRYHLYWAHGLWVQVLTLPSTSCVALAKVLLSEPLFPPLQNGTTVSACSGYKIKMNELTGMKPSLWQRGGMLPTGFPIKCPLSEVPVIQGEALETPRAQRSPRSSTNRSQGNRKNVNL